MTVLSIDSPSLADHESQLSGKERGAFVGAAQLVDALVKRAVERVVRMCQRLLPRDLEALRGA